MSVERRTWDSVVRSPWNPKIFNLLKAIDLHVELHLKTGDSRHLVMAQTLRQYLYVLKDWIVEEEFNQSLDGLEYKQQHF